VEKIKKNVKNVKKKRDMNKKRKKTFITSMLWNTCDTSVCALIIATVGCVQGCCQADDA